jgi:hypothetical protein
VLTLHADDPRSIALIAAIHTGRTALLAWLRSSGGRFAAEST